MLLVKGGFSYHAFVKQRLPAPQKNLMIAWISGFFDQREGADLSLKNMRIKEMFWSGQSRPFGGLVYG
ncbi:hypothetical protein AN476_13190 [Phaeobacter sp. 11ANDIMAR09]|nr:hypothetical protein AN476_13190 [Phaeobacter sp. 11ANDIMAR09]